MEVILRKLPNGAMAPASEDEADKLRKIKAGAGVRCEIVQIRNYQFHKKWFALAKVAYDLWREWVEMPTHRGEPVQPTFDRFRKDLTILAGYYETEFNIRGELRLRAKSISFASMDQGEFDALYSATIDAILQKVLGQGATTEAKLRRQVDEIMKFD